MTRKDYVAIAAVLNRSRAPMATPEERQVEAYTLKTVAINLAYHFAHTNERFDTNRFLKACGVSEESISLPGISPQRAALEQIERLSRTADRKMVDVPAMLGDIARKAVAA